MVNFVEKRPDSWRLNLADFPEVGRTDWAAGKITDFQKAGSVPLEAKPMVKVQVSGMDESGFIPIFFCPKAQYWDGGAGARAFDQDKNYYTQSWMSFRYNDSVMVMLQADKPGDSLTPRFVFGFADTVPRIGEAVFKCGYLNKCYKMFTPTAGQYTDGELGPDGLDLKLVTECERLVEAETITDIPYSAAIGVTFGDHFQYEVKQQTGPPWFWYFEYSWDAYIQNLYARDTRYYWNYRYLIQIGPILFVLRTSTTKTITKTSAWAETVGGTHYAGSSTLYPTQADAEAGGQAWVAMKEAENYALCYGGDHFPTPITSDEEALAFLLCALPPIVVHTYWGLIDYVNLSPPYNDPDLHDYIDTTTAIHAAINTPDNQAIARNVSQWPPGEPFITQMTTAMLTSIYTDLQHVRVANLDLDLYVRPHTKAELQDADMWPEDLKDV